MAKVIFAPDLVAEQALFFWCFDQWGEESQRMIWWCISTDMNVSGAKAYHKFYFKNAEDAAFFKLSWHR
jgi:hypothetical protein